MTLVPGTGGIFEIAIDGELIWERKRDGGFPDVKTLKQMVRDRSRSGAGSGTRGSAAWAVGEQRRASDDSDELQLAGEVSRLRSEG